MIHKWKFFKVFSYDIIAPNSCWIGLLPSSECEKKECDDAEYEDPDTNNCVVRDGFKRRYLYRAWRPACNDLHLRKDIIAAEYNAYILDYSDSLHYGSQIVFRCLPGFMLNTSTHSFVRKGCDSFNFRILYLFFCNIFDSF